MHGQPKNHCENDVRNTRCCTVHSGQHHSMPQRRRLWRTFEELGQEALENYFDMRQGKAESIQDHIFREEILTVALQKDTAIDLDEKIRGYWLMRTSNLTEREISGIRSSLRGRHSSRRSRRPSPRRLLQRNVRKSGMISVRQETQRETALVDTTMVRKLKRHI